MKQKDNYQVKGEDHINSLKGNDPNLGSNIDPNLVKLYYVTNLGFPEKAGDFPYFSPPFGDPGRVRSRPNLIRSKSFLVMFADVLDTNTLPAS